MSDHLAKVGARNNLRSMNETKQSLTINNHLVSMRNVAVIVIQVMFVKLLYNAYACVNLSYS